MSEHIEALLEKSPGPRVTKESIEDLIVRQQFHLFPGTTTIACLLELKNGYTVLGQSACADPANFNTEIGTHYAREDAVKKIWQLEGYLLKQKLYEAHG